jgi:8-oxo-dGTP pyrophosphatase MutT (NUDIX family)
MSNLPTLDPDALRARLAGPWTKLPDDIEASWHPGPDERLVPAAVLVPFVLYPRPAILLTRRASHLAKHPGQVSFPGGRIDPTDDSAEAAALREAHEEVGLDPALVELAGRMPDQITGTGYIITPVLGLLTGRLEGLGLVPAPDEVDSLFCLDLGVLLDPALPRRHSMERPGGSGGQRREFWVWPHDEHHIWGATAAILRQLALRLRAG